MKRIAIYGKGGIGKSTTTANVATALAEKGLTVMQLGCDPKADSTILHTRGVQSTTILELLRKNGGEAPLDAVIHKGQDGVYCAECGGPMPGTGCAGRGIVTAFEYLEKMGAYEEYKPDVLLYDVLGDVVCGGFAMPLRRQYARNVYIVTSGEKMSLYAAANIALALENFKGRGYAQLSGLIQNSRDVPNEETLISEMAEELHVPVAGSIRRDPLLPQAEALQRTLLEAFPESDTANDYRKLAQFLLDHSEDA